MDIHLDVDNGVISKVAAYSDTLYPKIIDGINATFTGISYDRKGIEAATRKIAEGLKADGEVEAANLIPELERWLVEAI